MMVSWLLALALAFQASGELRQVSESGRGAYEASLTPFRDGFAAAWYDTRDGNPELLKRVGLPYTQLSKVPR